MRGGGRLEIEMRDVVRARARIRGHVWPTPLLDDRELSRRRGAPVHLKMECWQRTGSFKVRGAFHRMLHLTPEERLRGVIAVSAGNHAQGVALAARELGVSALVVMPESASRVKVEAVRALGGEVLLRGEDYDAADRACAEILEDSGRTLVHPFEDPLVIAGQGTVGLEVALSAADAEIVLVPAGGGGLAVGSAIALKTLRPGVKVYGVQSEASAPLVAAHRAGRRVPVQYGPSLADGLHGDTTDAMVELALRHLDGMLVVSEEAIARAMRYLFDQQRIVVEGSAAVGVAALLEGAAPEGAAVAVLTGRNVAPEAFLRIAAGAEGAS